MGWLTTTAALYARVFRRAAELTARNWPLAFLAMGYPVLLRLLRIYTGPLGIVGGFIWTTAVAACLSSWLHFIEQAIRTGNAHLPDLPRSFGSYLADLINVGFLLFLLQLVAVFVLAPFPFLAIVFALATVAFLNAVPELVYLGRYPAAELLVASYRFIGENWIEWFPANLLLFGAVLGVDLLMPSDPYGLIPAAAVGLVLTYVWIVRGLLFIELTVQGRRAREFHRRAAG